MSNDGLRWRVLLIGGSSGTGKTAVGRELAKRYGLSLVLVDDVRMAIQAVASPREHPALHTFVADGSRALRSSETVCTGLIAVAEAVEPALRMIMVHHIATKDAGAIIVEGDGILPCLASLEYLRQQPEFSGVNVEGTVKGVFLREDDRQVIFENMQHRGRGFQAQPVEGQQALSEGSWKYGRYLVEWAEKISVPVLSSRPFDTLGERIEQIVGRG
jgi:2-phosphoglycerate kinase